MYAINLEICTDDLDTTQDWFSTVQQQATLYGVITEDTSKVSPNKYPIYRFTANSLGSLSQYVLVYTGQDQITARHLIGEYLEVL